MSLSIYDFTSHCYKIGEENFDIVEISRESIPRDINYFQYIAYELSTTAVAIHESAMTIQMTIQELEEIESSNTLVTLIQFAKDLRRHLKNSAPELSLEVWQAKHLLKDILENQKPKCLSLFLTLSEDFQNNPTEKTLCKIGTHLIVHHKYANQLPQITKTKELYLSQISQYIPECKTDDLLHYICSCSELDPEHKWLFSFFENELTDEKSYAILSAIKQFIQLKRNKQKNIFLVHCFCCCFEEHKTNLSGYQAAYAGLIMAKKIQSLFKEPTHSLLKRLQIPEETDHFYLMSKFLPLALKYNEISQEKFTNIISCFLEFPNLIPHWYKYLFREKIREFTFIPVINSITTITNQDNLDKAREFSKRIFSRYIQILKTISSYQKFKRDEILHFAFYIELQIPRIHRLALSVFENLPSLMFHDGNTHDNYIVLGEKIKKIENDSGTSKEVKMALFVPSNSAEESIFIACSINKPFKHKDEVTEYKQELALHKTLTNKPGIWPIIFSHKIINHKLDSDIKEQVFTFMPLAHGNLSILKKHRPKLTQKIHVCLDIAKGIHTIHSSGYIHGDLNESNILIKVAPNGQQFTTGIIDLGLAQPLIKASQTFPISHKKYGNLWYTPLELMLCKDPRTLNPIKIELWVLGCLIHNIILNAYPSWISYFSNEVHAVQHMLSPRSLQKFEEEVDGYEHQRSSLVLEAEPTLEQKLLLLIFDLLRKNPQERIDSSEVVQRLEQLTSSS